MWFKRGSQTSHRASGVSWLRYRDCLLEFASKIERVIRHYKLPIKHYVSGEEVVRSKPDPAIFHLAASRIGHAPEDCLVIEDAANGMIGSKAAGMEVIALLDDRMPMQRLEQADHVARSHAEIEEILRKR